MLAFIVYKCKTERVRVGRPRYGTGRSMAGAGKLIDGLCEAGSGLGLLWVTGGKTRREYMFSGLAQVADIVRSALQYLANPPQLRVLGRAIPCSGSRRGGGWRSFVRHPGVAEALKNALAFAPIDRACRVERHR